MNLSLEIHKNFSKILKNKKDTIFAILGGSVSDKKEESVSYGDIVRTIDFKVLSKVFKIKKNLSVARVFKSA